MILEGTVVNGVIVLAGGARLPEGERVRVRRLDDGDITPSNVLVSRDPEGSASDVRSPSDLG